MDTFRMSRNTMFCCIAWLLFSSRPAFGFSQNGRDRIAPWAASRKDTATVLRNHHSDVKGMSFTDDDFFSDLPSFGSSPSILSCEDPENIDFVLSNDEKPVDGSITMVDEQSVSYLRESAMYIADHRENTVVIHIPGEFIQKQGFSNLLDDIALIWLLGLKIVLVVGGRFQQDCHEQSCGLTFSHPHEYHNSIHVTDGKLLRNVQEEAGYVRFEVERKLNKSLRLHGGMGPTNKNAPGPNGNVVSGNFYTASQFGVVQGVDYKNTGYPRDVHVEKIQRILSKNDIVLLTPVGSSRMGDVVNVNSNHLAAFVAASMRASKLMYMSSTACVLQSKVTQQRMLDIPLSCSKSLVQYHDVKVHDAGFVSFGKARNTLDAATVEKLILLGWCNWALDHGVQRAHVVGPNDGDLLEELFTATDGTNTCVRQENDTQDLQNVFAEEVELFEPLPPFLRK